MENEHSSGGVLPLALLLIAAMLSPGELPAQTAGGNDFYNFSVVDVSGTEMRVTVEYTYTADQPLDKMTLLVCALQSDEQQVPGTACTHVAIGARSGRETIDVSAFGLLGDGVGRTSTMVEVCLYAWFERIVNGKRGEEVYCERFPWTKEWMADLGGSGSDSTAERPEILAFTATPSTVPLGGAVTLRWETSNAERTSILPLKSGSALDEALAELATLEPRLVEIAKLRLGLGLSVDETAETLGLGPHTVEHDWQRALAFLQTELGSVNEGTAADDWEAGGLVHGTDNTVPDSGDLEVRPEVTTFYTLRARNGAVEGEEVSKTVGVNISEAPAAPAEPEPPPPPTTCSISGRVIGRLRVTLEDPQGIFTGREGHTTFELEEMGLFAEDFSELLIRTPLRVVVPERGRYEFSGVPVGTYGLAPLGGAWRYSPRRKTVTCTPGDRLRVDFDVMGIQLES